MDEITSEVLTDSQLRRAEAITIARHLWPHAVPERQYQLAQWVITGKWVQL
jgi:hypothetical protein